MAVIHQGWIWKKTRNRFVEPPFCAYAEKPFPGLRSDVPASWGLPGRLAKRPLRVAAWGPEAASHLWLSLSPLGCLPWGLVPSAPAFVGVSLRPLLLATWSCPAAVSCLVTICEGEWPGQRGTEKCTSRAQIRTRVSAGTWVAVVRGFLASSWLTF